MERKSSEQVLKEHGFVLSIGYEGKEEYLYTNQTLICKCCKGYYHSEYYTICDNCGNNVMCYNCATGDNECINEN